MSFIDQFLETSFMKKFLESSFMKKVNSIDVRVIHKLSSSISIVLDLISFLIVCYIVHKVSKLLRCRLLDIVKGKRRIKVETNSTDMADIHVFKGQNINFTRATSGSAGFDLCATEDYVLCPKEIVKINTGISITMSDKYAGFIVSRSGLASKGIVVANSPGIIDSDFSGEIKVLLRNDSADMYNVIRGDRIAQLLFVCINTNVNVEVEEKIHENIIDISNNVRGDGAFGSTGR